MRVRRSWGSFVSTKGIYYFNKSKISVILILFKKKKADVFKRPDRESGSEPAYTMGRFHLK